MKSMKTTIALTALAAASLLSAGSALAQGYYSGYGPGGPRYDDHRGPPPGDRYEGHHDDHRGWDPRFADRGPGGRPEYLRNGGRLPGEYRDRTYVVDDWRGHRLAPPPRGYHWVQVGADYALVAIASGIIAQVLFN